MFYRLMARLLEYPQQEMLDALPEIRQAVKDLEVEEGEVVEAFLQHVSTGGLLEAQAGYVQSFDMTPQHTLHLTHHLFGDDKNRGPALIDLSEYYKQYGLEITGHEEGVQELPDYLPLMLEFVSRLEADAARMFLSQWQKVLRQLTGNLQQAQSIYAPLLALIEQHSRLVQSQASPA